MNCCDWARVTEPFSRWNLFGRECFWWSQRVQTEWDGSKKIHKIDLGTERRSICDSFYLYFWQPQHFKFYFRCLICIKFMHSKWHEFKAVKGQRGKVKLRFSRYIPQHSCQQQAEKWLKVLEGRSIETPNAFKEKVFCFIESIQTWKCLTAPKIVLNTT